MAKAKAFFGIAFLLAGILVGAPAGAGPSAGGLSSDNVEFIRHIPLAQDGVGGRLIGRYFYANDQNKIMIFDTKTPEDPQLLSVLPMPQEWLFSREDLDGNGKILVVPNGIPQPEYGQSGGALYVVDVEDKSNPVILSTLPGANAHTSSCVLDCDYVWNSDGRIIDLTTPAKPKLTEAKWGDGMPATSGHDVEEIAPGIVLTATQPMMLLDARKDPLHPKLLALGSNEDGRFIHSVRWSRGGKDDIIVAGGETNFRPRCGETNGAFMTWDASDWKRTGTFRMVDEYRAQNGTFADGNPTVNYSGGCSSHWLEPHPKFNNGGFVAAAFFENGTRFLQIASNGKIKEVGYFMPWAGSTGAAYWITNEIVYTLDYNRGIDVIRFTGAKK